MLSRARRSDKNRNKSGEKRSYGDDPWYRARLDQFTPEQVSVISSFLECVREDERFYDHYADVERGLKFWNVSQDETSV